MKGPQFEEFCYDPPPIPGMGAPLATLSPEWEPPKSCSATARCDFLDGGNPCSRDMSPICSDTSDAEEAEGATWGCPQGAPVAPPPPPPPPPEAQHATQMLNIQNRRQFSISLGPADSSFVSGVHTVAASNIGESGNVDGAPTPPWRKRRNVWGGHPVSIRQDSHLALSAASWVDQQRQHEPQHLGIKMGLGGPLEDPYALSLPADPCASSSCCSSSSNCFSSPLETPHRLQQLNTLTPAGKAVSTVSTTSTGNDMRVLLPLPIPNERPPPPPGPPGAPRCAPYLYVPPKITSLTARGEEDQWLLPDIYRMRQRLRARQRREGVHPQRSPGCPPPLPVLPHCYYPSLQQQHHQPDKALLALRRTCYRCRRRGHEASECPSGQTPR